MLPRPVRRLLVRWGTPSYTVGALCVIRRHDGRILLVSQAYRRRWGLPGGLVARGEGPADAVRREVREEVGVELDLGAPTVVVEPTPRRVDVVFPGTPRPGQDLDDLAPQSPEITDIGWFALDALPDLQEETVAALAALEDVADAGAHVPSSVSTAAGDLDEAAR